MTGITKTFRNFVGACIAKPQLDISALGTDSCSNQAANQSASEGGKFVANCELKVLLVGENAAELDPLRQQIQKRGYRCWLASSVHEYAELLALHHFPLVLSMIPPGRESFIYDQETIAVFYCFPVHNDCWWLPVMRKGKRCFGDRGLRAREFSALLDRFQRELQPTA